ncbi:hypothetical protein X777_04864 [Ooceraea biroi]|uniref:Uncharacterized protein n=1 Tax=Ooceraea biroi TaxID=2015173 RepID=A0A026WGZ9_OOCBI|nr:hypothetical protein X777_04864 [Ooceraea biroi]
MWGKCSSELNVSERSCTCPPVSVFRKRMLMPDGLGRVVRNNFVQLVRQNVAWQNTRFQT